MKIESLLHWFHYFLFPLDFPPLLSLVGLLPSLAGSISSPPHRLSVMSGDYPIPIQQQLDITITSTKYIAPTFSSLKKCNLIPSFFIQKRNFTISSEERVVCGQVGRAVATADVIGDDAHDSANAFRLDLH